MTTMNISLPDDMRAFVDEQVAAGGYGTTSEYIRDLIREKRKEAARAKLEALLIEGLESGEPVEANADFWRELREEARRRWEQRKGKHAHSH